MMPMLAHSSAFGLQCLALFSLTLSSTLLRRMWRRWTPRSCTTVTSISLSEYRSRYYLPAALTMWVATLYNRLSGHTSYVPTDGPRSASSSCICGWPSGFTATISTTSWRLTNFFLLGRSQWRPQLFGTVAWLSVTSRLATYSTLSPSNPMTPLATSRTYLSCGLQTAGLVYTRARFQPLSGFASSQMCV